MDNSEGKLPLLDEQETPLGSVKIATSGVESPVIYVDLIRGAMIFNEVARINLYQTRIDSLKNELVNKQVATLVMPASQLAAWGEFLLKISSRETFTESEEPSNAE
jgi:hypothetical protein